MVWTELLLMDLSSSYLSFFQNISDYVYIVVFFKKVYIPYK